jgi:hypothetical protein
VLDSSYSIEKFKAGSKQFAEAIAKLCSTCEKQAPNETAAATLNDKCFELRRAAQFSGRAPAKAEL